jgi:hypothetical protein
MQTEPINSGTTVGVAHVIKLSNKIKRMMSHPSAVTADQCPDVNKPWKQRNNYFGDEVATYPKRTVLLRRGVNGGGYCGVTCGPVVDFNF